MASSSSLHNIPDSNNLTDPNYMDRLRNLRIVPSSEHHSNILDIPSLESLGNDVSKDIIKNKNRKCKANLAKVKTGALDALKSMYKIHTILTLNSSISNTWVLDTACGYHICKSLQGLHKIKVLMEGDFNLYGAGGETIQAEAIGTYILKLPSGKILELDNCYYMPKIIRNIISIPLLLKQGYVMDVTSNGCSIMLSNKFICSGMFNNGLLTLSLNNNVYLVDKKRKRESINITFLWHS